MTHGSLCANSLKKQVYAVSHNCLDTGIPEKSIKYISLLRGINVSGQKRIQMADLAKVYESIKLTDVKTYIQSGNVVFSAPESFAEKLRSKIEKAIQKAYGFKADVVLRTAEEWQQILKSNPFLKKAKKPEDQLYVALLRETAEDQTAELLPYCKAKEKFVFSGRELYLHYPEKFGATKLTLQVIENKLGAIATVRNWNTMQALGELADTDKQVKS